MRFGEELPAKYNLTSLKVIACAGEPLNPEAWRWAQTYLCGDGSHGYCVDNWWQTELAMTNYRNAYHHADARRKAGVPLPGVDADIVDAEGKCSAEYGRKACLAETFSDDDANNLGRSGAL